MYVNWAYGVVVSHPLRMRKALGSNPSVSILHFKKQQNGAKMLAFLSLFPFFSFLSFPRFAFPLVILTRQFLVIFARVPTSNLCLKLVPWK